ncbi:hypothetical protein RchiOBHm_Chr3g0478571 [Rosa chinensis]|uniref:Uncharacterized protein n=1 Tax=Rosa chinensis TaxID=74649 RepID=A0A2P6RDA3_ROSCH|nr:hypothetical protein RchiOBHm_Chr3g0478571 [Rosa chinensis]
MKNVMRSKARSSSLFEKYLEMTKLLDYNIEGGSVLHLVLALRGGSL